MFDQLEHVLPPNDLVKRRGGCGVVPSTASMVVRVSPPIAAAIAASA